MATTKRELTNRIATKLNVKQELAKSVVQAFLDEIVEELVSGNRLEFRDFGIFDIIQKKARTARNPRTGEPVQIPAKRVVHFKAGRVMKERVMKEPDEQPSSRPAIARPPAHEEEEASRMAAGPRE